MHEDEQAETFNQDQQEMFQNPNTNLGETRPRTPGTENVPPAAPGAGNNPPDESSTRTLDNPNLI